MVTNVTLITMTIFLTTVHGSQNVCCHCSVFVSDLPWVTSQEDTEQLQFLSSALATQKVIVTADLLFFKGNG